MLYRNLEFSNYFKQKLWGCYAPIFPIHLPLLSLSLCPPLENDSLFYAPPYRKLRITTFHIFLHNTPVHISHLSSQLIFPLHLSSSPYPIIVFLYVSFNPSPQLCSILLPSCTSATEPHHFASPTFFSYPSNLCGTRETRQYIFLDIYHLRLIRSWEEV